MEDRLNWLWLGFAVGWIAGLASGAGAVVVAILITRA